MVIIDPKTDKVFDNIVDAWYNFQCPGPCSDCPLTSDFCEELRDKRETVSQPYLIAEKMGYTVIEGISKEEYIARNSMTADSFYKELIRLHKHNYSYEKACTECPLSQKKIPCNLLSIDDGENYIGQLILEVKNWSEKNPRKTILEDFNEKYPSAEKNEYNFPRYICPYMLGVGKYVKPSECNKEKCKQCWSQYIEI